MKYTERNNTTRPRAEQHGGVMTSACYVVTGAGQPEFP